MPVALLFVAAAIPAAAAGVQTLGFDDARHLLNRTSFAARLTEVSKFARLTREQVRKGIELRSWWWQEMLAISTPLGEKMTLFRHNHFVSSQQKGRSPRVRTTGNAWCGWN